MAEFRVEIEKVESGRVRVSVYDATSASYDSNEFKAWSVETTDEWTEGALKSALKATTDFLAEYVSRSIGD